MRSSTKDFKERLKEPRVNKLGETMFVLDARSSTDIDVMFSTGVVKKGVQANGFFSGELTSRIREDCRNTVPYYTQFINGREYKVYDYNLQSESSRLWGSRAFTNRLGSTSISQSGEQMKIIDYENSEKMKVQFEDGTVVNNVRYKDFISGNVVKIKWTRKGKKESWIGRTSVNKLGEIMEVIDYRSSSDIDVLFSTGIIKRGVNSCRFTDGLLTSKVRSSYLPNIGVSEVEYNGEKYIVYDYRGVSKDQRVHGSLPATDHVGEIVDYGNGIKGKLVKYSSYKDVVVHYSFGWQSRTGYDKFKSGTDVRRIMKGILAKKLYKDVATKSGELVRLTNYTNKFDLTLEFPRARVIKVGVSFVDYVTGDITSEFENIKGVRCQTIMKNGKEYKLYDYTLAEFRDKI